MTTAETTSGRLLVVVTDSARMAECLPRLADMFRTPAGCAFTWCTSRMRGHTVHMSAPVPLPDDADRVLFAETCPDTGHLLYGPVLGGGDVDEPVGHARVLAALLRVAAARLDELGAA